MRRIFCSVSMTSAHFRFRLKTFSLLLIPLFVAAQLAAMSVSASGKPSIGLTSCKKKQIKKFQESKGGKKCTAKQTQDVVSSSATIHGIYCSSSGEVLCCEYKDGKVVNGSCETIKEVRVPFKPRPLENKATTSGKAERVTRPGPLDGGPQGGILEPNRGLSGTGPSATGSPIGGASSPGGAAPLR
jgi:hypothetical protein